ncbi:MAG TPA: nicotinamide riboside transporter PnuC [Woeseiaceae bacterium]|nr:nicotinamide riboside transporter PnuC [Woeseiaceae bacterium]
MSDLVVTQLRALTPLEMIAVITAVGYLVLAIRRNIWCWLFAVVSTASYIALCLRAKLYMESVLNLFYLAMAFYGWYAWRTAGDRESKLPVIRWPLLIHLRAIAAIAAGAACLGLLLDRFSDAAFPYADSATAIAAIWTTFLVARKVLENWWYWLAIDTASIYLYWARDLQLTALLFALYVALIPIGLVAWRRAYAEQQHGTAAA